jgi:serine protease AprX
MTKAGLAAMLVCLLGVTPSAFAGGKGNGLREGDHPKLDRKLNDRSGKAGGTSRVIIILKPGWDDSDEVTKLGGKLGRSLSSINGHVAELKNEFIRKLADFPGIQSIHWDRPTAGEMNYAAVTVGARAVQQSLGFTGAGVGVAVIDSGISDWHDDLSYSGSSSLVQMKNSQRVPAFVDFVNNRTTSYDDNGHGTHVAGIIAGNGRDSSGARAGIAPSAHVVSLKVLDANGRGVISNVIAALDWAVGHRTQFNIRVVNLSVGAPVTESYLTDPLTLAAKRAVDAGIVVVTAAGNLGRNALGQTQYGAITAPGNAPWVLTVGAYSHNGTTTRTDDTMASFSSRGPSAIDYEAKPDIVAPGVGIVSLSDPGGLFYVTKAEYLVNGTLLSLLGQKPYLSLSGTSMASPMVAGTVALMIEANPKLTPNLVKGILEYTAQVYPGYNALTQGAGFLNSKGAVDLAGFYYTAQAGQTIPTKSVWSRSFNWGSHRVSHGVIKPNAPAWKLGEVWGAAKESDGDNIVWGTVCRGDCDNIVWGTADDRDNIVWGTASNDGDNIVWGTFADGDNIVWGTSRDGDNIVWGTDCGGADCDSVVWGTSRDGDNIVWGTASDGDNIVWGTSRDGDNIVWGTSADEDVTWGSSGEDNPLFDDPDAPPPVFDSVNYDDLFGPPAVTTTVTTILGGVL